VYEKIKLVIEIERKKINIELVYILWSFIFTAYNIAIVIVFISTSHAIFRRFTTRDALILFLAMKYIWVMYIRKFKYVLRNSVREPPSR